MDEQRPAPDPTLSGAELRRWYWLRTELADLARACEISAAGSKDELTDRLAAHLDTPDHPATDPVARTRPAHERPLDPAVRIRADTVLPPGQPCTQALRAYLREAVGPGFRFDAAVRAYVRDGPPGRTAGDVVAHWHRTRGAGPVDIGAQFELNRFTRAWWADHPDGDREALRAAWLDYRRLPVERRGRA